MYQGQILCWTTNIYGISKKNMDIKISGYVIGFKFIVKCVSLT